MKTRSMVGILVVGLSGVAMAAACGDDSVDDGASSSSSTTTATTTSQGGSVSGSGSSSGSGSGSGGAEPVVEEVVAFDPASFELPEGLAIRGNDALVGLAFSGAIDTVPLGGGAATGFASLPAPPPNTSFMTGVGIDTDGAVYGALVSFTADAQAGIYRAPSTGGPATLFASDPSMVFPNGLAWSEDGTLYVTDSSYGGVFSVASDGAATPWITDPLFEGEPTACGGTDTDLSVGANGLLFSEGALYVASSNKGVLAKVPILADGSPGTLEVIAGPDCAIGGIDGIALDEDGTFIGAINKQDKLVRIDSSGHIETLVEGGKLDFPASVAFAGAGSDRALYVTSFAYLNATQGMPAHPALLRIRLSP